MRNQAFSVKSQFTAIIGIVIAAIIYYFIIVPTGRGDLPTFFYSISAYIGFGSGGIFGILLARKIGKSSLGNFFRFAGAGLICTTLGFMIWDYYLYFLGVDSPYPSIADIGYILTAPLVFIGLILLLKSYRVSISKKAITAFGIVFIVILLANIIFQWDADPETGASLTYGLDQGLGNFFFNVFYNVSDALTVAASVVMLAVGGGKLIKGMRFFTFGFLLLAIANITFTYRIFTEVYYTGDIADILLVLSGVIMSLGLVIAGNRLYSQNKN